MEKKVPRRILISSHPKRLAEEVKNENPKDIVHFFYDSEDQSFEKSDISLKDYDYIFLTDEDYSQILPKIGELTNTHLCVIYTDLEAEFFLIPPGTRIDSYCFGLFDDWLSHINSVLRPSQTHLLKRCISITKLDWEKNSDVSALMPKIIESDRISKNLEENIKFILRELISNAFLHTQTEESMVEFEKRSQDVVLRVTDFHGHFPKHRFISTIFRQKRIVEPSNQTKGAGIGLFLVAQIANELNIKTCPTGTSIEVIIPLRKIAGQAAFYKKILSFKRTEEPIIKRDTFYSTSTS